MRIRKKFACYLMLGFVISLGCAEAQADSSPDEIVAVDLLIVKKPKSQAESRLRVIRLTTRSGTKGYGDYLDFGLPVESAEETLARLVNRYAEQNHKKDICLTDPSMRAVGIVTCNSIFNEGSQD